MQVFIVEAFLSLDSLDTQRGILVDNVLILPDPLCPGEVIVRLRGYLGPYVNLVNLGKVELPDVEMKSAVDNQIYNAGWFKAFFESAIKDTGDMKHKGM